MELLGSRTGSKAVYNTYERTMVHGRCYPFGKTIVRVDKAKNQEIIFVWHLIFPQLLVLI